MPTSTMKKYRIVAHYRDTHCDLILATLPSGIDRDELEGVARETFAMYYRAFHHLDLGPYDLDITITEE